MATIGFFDGYWYCYANSTAMLLSSIGEDISPKLIESLTGVGLGAMYHEKSGLTFFSGAKGEPDVGITKSLEILGFKFVEEGDFDDPPYRRVEELLPQSPVVAGPVDMSFLNYNPNRPKTEGVDHFVLIHRINDDKIYLNDPAGFLNVFILRDEFTKAWKATRIGYKRGSYRFWAQPKRKSNPSEDDIYEMAMNFFRDLYAGAEQEKREGKKIDEEAIVMLADGFKERKLKDFQINFLSGFALPLGAKRALDFAGFVQKHNQKLAGLKYDQSKLFGEAQSLLMNNRIEELVVILNDLASIETRIQEEILATKRL